MFDIGKLARNFALVGLLTLAFATSPVMISLEASAYVSRAPIFIDGNAAFTVTNGVTHGSGTGSDPYLIQGWDIDASTANGIEIRNTNAYFVLRGVHVHSGIISNNDGIFLDHVSNGVVSSNMIESGFCGIRAVHVNNLKIVINEVSRNYCGGIAVLNSTGVTIEGNIVSSNTGEAIGIGNSMNVNVSRNRANSNNNGILASFSIHIMFSENSASRNGGPGIGSDSSTYVTIVDNNSTLNYQGLGVANSGNVVVLGNRIESNSYGGLVASRTSNLTLIENDFVSNFGWAVGLLQSTGVLAFHNNLYHVYGIALAHDDGANQNSWDNGYPDGGNFWSEYAGVDDCSGPSQIVCADPDGVGDTPYVIDLDSRDRYPLMKPFLAMRSVSIDIKPGSDPNPINVKSMGSIPVAILSGPGFDALIDVDRSSLTFGRTGGEPSLVFCNASSKDVNEDGLLDLVCHFDNQRAAFKAGDTVGIVRGLVLDSTFIEGTASVRAIFPGDANGDLEVNVLDLVLVGSAYGSTPTSSNWNLDADFDENGLINILDLVMVGRYFGQHA